MADATTAQPSSLEPGTKVPASELPVGHRTWLARYWVGKIDIRPFAAFRIAFGLFLFYDLCDLLPQLRTFFSDEGVLPRVAFLGQWARQARFSGLDSFGTVPGVHIFWAIAAISVLCLAAGYRTRIASVVAFLCLASFQERLPPLFDGSDTVIRMVLFWHMFCPTGNLWSVDALQAARRGKPLATLVNALPFRLMQLQLGLIYLITGAHKIQGTTWRNGDAVHYTLHLTHVFSRPWARAEWFADNVFISSVMTWGTLVFEFGFLFFAFLPVPWPKVSKLARAFAIASASSLHIGIMFTINVGLFSYLMPLCLLMYWEPEWTQKLVDSIAAFLGPSRVKRIEELALALPEPRGWENAPSTWFGPLTRARATLLARVALGVWFVMCSWYATPPYIRNWTGQELTVAARTAARARLWFVNEEQERKQIEREIAAISVNPMPRWEETPVQALDVWSSWDMFSPEPLRTDYHLTAPGELENGVQVNLFDDPTGEQRGFWFSRWWKYFENVTGGDQLLPLEWGRYMCREQNYAGAKQPRLYTFTLYKDNQIIPPIGQPWPPVSRQTVWVHRCFDKPAAPGAPGGPAVAEHPAGQGPVRPPGPPRPPMGSPSPIPMSSP